MNNTIEMVNKVTIREKGLDPIAVYYEDFGIGNGKITITCYGKAWTSHWNAMGDQSIIDFFLSCDEHYLAKNLSDIDSSVIDYDKISKDIGCEVEHSTLLYQVDEVIKVYGTDWYLNLPHTSNHEYEYLCRILKAVQTHFVNLKKDES